MIVVEHNDNETIDEMINRQLYEVDYSKTMVLPINTYSFKWVDCGTIRIDKIAKDNNWDLILGSREDFIFFDTMGGDTAMHFMGESENCLYYTMKV